MKTAEAIAKLGVHWGCDSQAETIQRLADALGITREAIYQWGEDVPWGRAYQIRDILEGRQ